MDSFKDLEKQVAAVLGIRTESCGKTQARQDFLPLVDRLEQSSIIVEITDRDKPVAVLLSYSHWLALASKLSMLSKREGVKLPNLVGSLRINSDLQVASDKIAQKFQKSIKQTRHEL